MSHPLRAVSGSTAGSVFVRAVRGERAATTPVWFPQLASPVLSAQRAALGGVDAFDAGGDPERVAELTVGVAELLDVDAVALVGDPLAPARLAGVRVQAGPAGAGVVTEPVRTASEVLRLRPVDPDALAPLAEAVRLSAARLGATPLVAVGAAPFALAALLSGDASADRLDARALMYRDPHTWAALLNWCADVTGAFLRVAVEAGASVAALADVGIGALSRRDYQRRVAPHSRRALDALRGLDVPMLHLGEGTAEVLDLVHGLGVDAVEADRRVPLDEASARLGGGVPLLGNLDPALLLAGPRVLRAHIDDVLDRGLAAPAHLVTVGGALPAGVDTAVVAGIVEAVHERR